MDSISDSSFESSEAPSTTDVSASLAPTYFHSRRQTAVDTPPPSDPGWEKLLTASALFKLLDPRSFGFIRSPDFARILALGGQPLRVVRALLQLYRIGEHGTSSAYLSAEASAAVEQASAECFPVDYPRFELDARLARLADMSRDSNDDPPVAPWAQEQKRRSRQPNALASAVGAKASTWASHTEAYTQRRFQAASWLMTRGFRSKTQLAVRDRLQRVLVRSSEQVVTVKQLTAVAKEAARQVAAQRTGRAWIKERLKRARRHVLLRAECFRLLKVGHS